MGSSIEQDLLQQLSGAAEKIQALFKQTGILPGGDNPIQQEFWSVYEKLTQMGVNPFPVEPTELESDHSSWLE